MFTLFSDPQIFKPRFQHLQHQSSLYRLTSASSCHRHLVISAFTEG